MVHSSASTAIIHRTAIPDSLTSDRQLHLLCEGWKKGLGFDGLRQLVSRFYGAEVKPCQLHWTEVDRLIIEIWRQDIRRDTDHH